MIFDEENDIENLLSITMRKFSELFIRKCVLQISVNILNKRRGINNLDYEFNAWLKG